MKFYANPYDTSANGFYFETYEEYVEKSEALKNSFGDKVEEFEIDTIDGTREEIQLCEVIKVNQCNLEEVIDFLDGVENDWPAVFFQLDNGLVESLDEAIRKADEYCIVEDNLLNAATELFDECQLESIPKEVRSYIDYEAFARDCRLNGDMHEFEFAGKTYTCTNSNQQDK